MKKTLFFMAIVLSLFIVQSVLPFTIVQGDVGEPDDPQDEIINSLPAGAVLASIEEINPYFTVVNFTLADGTGISKSIINGPPVPPAGFEAEREASIQPLPSIGTIDNFPSYNWVFGCSAVSGAMIAAYYDRNGYPDMYIGPTNGGVMPITDTSWPTWCDAYDYYPSNPLVASKYGLDGRTIKGSIEDYWVKYESSAPDPYIGNWAEHYWGTAIGDYMKTSQSKYGNVDGSTIFYHWTSSGDKMTCDDMKNLHLDDNDGTYGRKLFYETRGYTVTDCYSRRTDVSGGFSLADFKAEIDSGHPVLINLEGHSIVGYGYSGDIIYIRDTWDSDPNNTYTMTWGGYYDDMKMVAVSVVKLAPLINQTPTNISLSNNTVPENEPVNTVVGTLSTSDPDAGDTHTYKLVDGEGSTDNASFNISRSDLRTSAVLNYEVKNSYSIRIRSTDKGGLYFEKAFTINVTDVNEAPTSISLSNNTVPENKPVDTVVGTLSTSDPDADDIHTYKLVDGQGSTDNASFNISGNNLRTSAVFNYEVKNSYSIRIRSTDKSGLYFEKAFTILVTGVNNAPVAVDDAYQTDMNQPLVVEAPGILANDSDPDGDDLSAIINIGPSNGTLNLSSNGAFSYTPNSGFSGIDQFAYTANDGEFNSNIATVIITVVATNQAPTNIALSNNTVPENDPVNTVVGTLSTSDPDAGDTHTYTLVSGEGSTDNASFNISGNSLRTSAEFNYEDKNSYSIRIRSTDKGGLYFEKAFTINVTDVNEAPTNIFLSNNNVPEGKPVNTIVGTFSTIDPDIGGTHTFALVSGSGSVDNVFFNIQGNALRTSAVFNKSVKDSYSIHVRTTDSGNLFYEKAFTINITDANGGKVIYLPLILKGGTSQVFGIINGGFEQGSVGWTEDSEYGWDLIYFYDDTTVDAHNGNWLAWLGGDNNEISRLSQTVKISPASPYLHFWYWIDSVDICGYDYARVKIDGNIVRTFKLCEDKNTYGWAHAAVNLSAYKGMTVSLMFEVTTDILYNSNFFLDDVSLSSSASATTNNLDKGELFVDPALDKEEFQKIY